VAVDANIKNATCTQFNPACDLTSAQKVQLQDSYSFRSWDYALQERKRIQSGVTLVGGVRHSYENYLARSYTEPRLGIEWEQSADTLYTAGWGRHNQMPVGQQVARNFGNRQLAHLRADHSVLGVTHKMDDGWSIKSETYLKRFRDLVVDDATLNYVNGGSGKAYGVEFLLKKDSGPDDDWSGWLSLSLARSSRFNDLTGQSFRFALDQPVNATLVSTWRVNEDWTLDARWQLHSGTPYTPINGTAGTYADGRPIPNYGALNSATLPVYHRLDIRLEKEWLHQHYAMKLFLEFNNVYFRKNVVGYTYDPTYTKRDPVYPFVLPLAFGMQVEF
jgi:outer membrane receptor protein involved in Fe transport